MKKESAKPQLILSIQDFLLYHSLDHQATYWDSLSPHPNKRTSQQDKSKGKAITTRNLTVT